MYECVSKIFHAHQEDREWQVVQLSAQSAIIFLSSESVTYVLQLKPSALPCSICLLLCLISAICNFIMASKKEQHICKMFGFRHGKRAWKVHERSKQFSLTMPLGAHSLLNGFSLVQTLQNFRWRPMDFCFWDCWQVSPPLWNKPTYFKGGIWTCDGVDFCEVSASLLHWQVGQWCVFLCLKLLDEARLYRNFCLRVMTGDDTWLYYSTQEPKSIPVSGKASLLHVSKKYSQLGWTSRAC